MEILYVVQLDATLKAGEADDSAYDILLLHVNRWITEKTGQAEVLLDLTHEGDFQRWNLGLASWEALMHEGARALRVTVRQADQPNVIFETRVTVAEIEGRTSIRVSLGREALGPGLTPAAAPAIKQPTLILSIASEKSLSITVEGASQDGRYLIIKSEDDAQAVSQAIRNVKRIPILLIHPRVQADWDAARTAAKRLVGLVRVVVAGYRYTRAISNEVPLVQVPFGGAALVWSRVESPPLLFTSSELAGLGDEGLRAQLMRHLADLSVRSRGSDRLWSTMRQIDVNRQVADAEERVSAAKAKGDSGELTQALQSQVAGLQAKAGELESLAQSYADDAKAAQDELAVREREVNSFRYKADALQSQILAMSAGGESSVAESLEDAPVLSPGDASASFDFLERVSSGKIVFTPNARTSWAKCALENYEQMTQALVALSRLAIARFGSAGPASKLDARLDDWIQSNFGLTVAFHDGAIETHNKADASFVFEDDTFSNVPHVKVTDSVPWPRVARIHFDFDNKGKRIVVNHVGNKLYR